jgi:glycine cleavage system H protein
VLPVPGTTCTVATDRSYSTDHIWVKSLPSNMVVIGITPSMVEILGDPHKISLVATGAFLSKAKGDNFGTIEGFKMTADLITPVSGQVMAMDNYLVAQSQDFGVLVPLSEDPFNSGWMLVVQLSNPSDLKSLLTAQAYVNLISSH